MARSGPEVADVFRRYGDAYRAQHGSALSTAQRRVMTAIELCRTAALGGHVEQCDQCGHQRISYCSCRNRHCPKCQSLARAQWLDDRRAELLATQYFHVVLTLPEEIAAISHQNKETVYGILFHAAAETLQTIAADPKHLGAEIGFFAVLHTWGQNSGAAPAFALRRHRRRPLSRRRPAGSPAGRDSSCLYGCSRVSFVACSWKTCRRPSTPGSCVSSRPWSPCGNVSAFRRYLAPLRKAKWVVYAKPPFAGPEQVLEYVGRYTHRVAISNNRLREIDDGKVSFNWKDYRDHNRQKVMTLAADEFIRRFLLHVLPEGFHRIRYYGLLGNRHRAQKLARCRELLDMTVSEPAHGQAEQDYRRPLRRTHRAFSDAMSGLPPRADDHHQNDRRRHDTAPGLGHVMIAACFHLCRIGPICLARPSHGDGFAALFRAPRHRTCQSSRRSSETRRQ